MAKYYGALGFVRTYEQMIDDEPTGKFRTETIERNYYGDILRNNRNWVESSEKVNEDITIGNQFSILVDTFAMENFAYLKYITYLGKKWLISSADIQYPRIILTTGGIYNG